MARQAESTYGKLGRVQPEGRATVLDASALLAFAREETGAALVRSAIPDAVVSTVNWSEFLQKSDFYRVNSSRVVAFYRASGLRVLPFDESHATIAAELWSNTQRLGISLADRACMALAMDLGLPILTADRRWTELDLPVPVESIR